MEPFKNLINKGTVEAIGMALQKAWPAFDRKRFQKLAQTGLDALEFKARARHVSAALESTLPEDFDQAAALLEATLAPPGAQNDPRWAQVGNGSLAGWAVWPMGEYVSRRGLQSPHRGLATLHALTQRFTAEWPIRAFIEQHPELTFATLALWARDPSEHVRRLVSEGSRPRLPWGLQLKGLIKDPAPTLPLLLALQDDASDYVRRSVANHLNDIAKDHPALVAEWLEEHLTDASPERRALLKHATRTLVKKGDPRVLKAWGLGKPLRGSATLAITPKRVSVGDSLELSMTLASSAARAQKLVIDYAVHHVKANGSTSDKVFKGWVLELAANEERTLRKSHSMRLITTRVYHAGHHAVDLRINGQVVASAGFDLRV
ncbi:MAG: DNA alkylation repair protein [Burkholderiales bacterium]|nr:DNA alkylation repair protein [Burkholderiales bacterium]